MMARRDDRIAGVGRGAAAEGALAAETRVTLMRAASRARRVVVARRARVARSMRAMAMTSNERSIAERVREAKCEVILGSGSSTRRAVLSSMGIDHVVVKPDIDEKAIRRDDPKALVRALAIAKADAAKEKLGASDFGTRRLLITCDQVVVHRGEIREKPSSEDEARAFIRGYGVDPPSTVGSTMVTDLSTGKSALAVDVNTVVFDAIPDDVVDAIVEEGECMHCAGGLMVEHELVQPYLRRIDGSIDGVMGLDAKTVERLLDELI